MAKNKNTPPASAAAAKEQARTQKADGDVVVAVRDGFYNGARRRKGAAFRLNKATDFSKHWMKRADGPDAAAAADQVEDQAPGVSGDVDNDGSVI